MSTGSNISSPGPGAVQLSWTAGSLSAVGLFGVSGRSFEVSTLGPVVVKASRHEGNCPQNKELCSEDPANNSCATRVRQHEGVELQHMAKLA